MKIKSQRDFWSGLMFVVVGIAFAWGATNYNFGQFGAARARATSRSVWACCMAALGAVVLFKALTIETADGDPVGSFAWKPLLYIVGTVAVFGWTLPHLGMFVALPDPGRHRGAGRRRVPLGRGRCSTPPS